MRLSACDFNTNSSPLQKIMWMGCHKWRLGMRTLDRLYGNGIGVGKTRWGGDGNKPHWMEWEWKGG